MATQNANESLNGTIWNLCPKESFCGPATVQMAVHLAVAIFNHGHEAIIPKVVEAMHCDVGKHTLRALGVVDEVRLYHSAKKSSKKAQTIRKKGRAAKKGYEGAAADAEGVTYGAGVF